MPPFRTLHRSSDTPQPAAGRGPRWGLIVLGLMLIAAATGATALVVLHSDPARAAAGLTETQTRPESEPLDAPADAPSQHADLAPPADAPAERETATAPRPAMPAMGSPASAAGEAVEVAQAAPRVEVPAPPAVNSPEGAMNPTQPRVVQSQLDAAFTLDARAIVPGPSFPGADVMVLPSRAPVVLRAAARQTGVLPGFFREVGRTYQWHAPEGQLWPSDQATSPGEAVWMPPTESRMLTLTAEVDIELARPAEGGGTQTAHVRRTATVRLLNPVSSGEMHAGIIDGYKVGEYLDPNDPHVKEEYNIQSDWFEKYRARYEVPRWFYRVTPEMKALHIAPHMTLGFWTIDFPWKSLGMPQYIALDMHLVQKLEDLRALMVADGYKITEFVPIYGFRPPAFNLGKILSENDTTLKVPFSMHQYGRACDLIIDEDGDHKLDDLNHDGKIDVQDAVVIMHYVNILDRQYRAAGRMEMVGGAGLYTHNDFLERVAAVGQTPYVHVDTRGFLEDDGRLVRWPAKWDNGEWIQWGKI